MALDEIWRIEPVQSRCAGPVRDIARVLVQLFGLAKQAIYIVQLLVLAFGALAGGRTPRTSNTRKPRTESHLALWILSGWRRRPAVRRRRKLATPLATSSQKPGVRLASFSTTRDQKAFDVSAAAVGPFNIESRGLPCRSQLSPLGCGWCTAEHGRVRQSPTNPNRRIGVKASVQQYFGVKNIYARILDRELKKGSAELVILALVEQRPRHGYEMSQMIEEQSDGAVRFKVTSLYPLLYRLEKRGWITGRWVEKAAHRRRRYYRNTPAGRRILAEQRRGWERFVAAINRIVEVRHA